MGCPGLATPPPLTPASVHTHCVSTRVYASRADPLLRSQVRLWEPFCPLKVTLQLSLSTGPIKTAPDRAPCRPAPPTGLSGLVSSHFTSALRCSGAGTYFCPSLFSVVGTQLPLPRLGCFPLGAWLTATCQGMPLPRGSPESGYISRPPAPVPRAPTTAVTEQPFRLPLSFQWELLGGRGHVNFPLSSPLRQHSARPKAGARGLRNP